MNTPLTQAEKDLTIPLTIIDNSRPSTRNRYNILVVLNVYCQASNDILFLMFTFYYFFLISMFLLLLLTLFTHFSLIGNSDYQSVLTLICIFFIYICPFHYCILLRIFSFSLLYNLFISILFPRILENVRQVVQLGIDCCYTHGSGQQIDYLDRISYCIREIFESSRSGLRMDVIQE